MPALASGVAVLLLLGVAAAQTPPPVVARQGYFFVGGTYFDAQDGRPALVKAIVALEPSGPPVHDNVEKGARLGARRARGNGHLFMLEKNSLDIAPVIARWLAETVPPS